MGTRLPWMGGSIALSALCLGYCRGLEATHITAASLLLQWQCGTTNTLGLKSSGRKGPASALGVV